MIDPASNFDQVCDVALAAGRVLAIKNIASSFTPNKVLDATGCIVMPGLVDLAARLREPGYEHEGMLESEMAAAVAGGVTSLVCPPDTDPVLDEPGLVEMLKFRSEKLHQARVFPLGSSHPQPAGRDPDRDGGTGRSGMRRLQPSGGAAVEYAGTATCPAYAATYGYTTWLRPQELHLGKGVAASGPLATRLGLAGVPVAAETIALHTIFELMKLTGARVHLCRLSSAAGVALVRQAKEQGLPVTCDVSINSLHLTDTDIGYFDSRMRLNPPLRQQRDRDALRAGLGDGTIDALVSDHTPVDEDAKTLPFAEAEAGATGLELLLGLALKWGRESGAGLARSLAILTSEPARVLGPSLGTLQASVGQLVEGGIADVCVFDPQAQWTVTDRRCAARASTRPSPATSWRGACAAPSPQARSPLKAGTADQAMTILRASWTLGRALVHAFAGLGTIRFSFSEDEPARREARVQSWSQRMLALLGVDLELRGQPPAGGPVLLVANHISWLDILVMNAARYCRFVSKSDVKRWPLIGTLATGGGTIYIERESRRDALRVVHHVAESLRRGEVVAVFPEGTTSDGVALLPFHANMIQAAISAGAPAQPVALSFLDSKTRTASLTPCYIGDDTLVGSLWRTVTGSRITGGCSLRDAATRVGPRPPGLGRRLACGCRRAAPGQLWSPNPPARGRKSPRGRLPRECLSIRRSCGRDGWAHGPARSGRWPAAACTETPSRGRPCA